MFFVCVYTLLKAVSHDHLSFLSMSKKNCGWVGGVGSIQFFGIFQLCKDLLYCVLSTLYSED